MDRYSQSPNPEMVDINIPKESPGQCYETDLPGTEDAAEIARTLQVKSCESLCFNNFQALPETFRTNSYLSFPTPAYLGAGKCRGHAIVTQQFSMLARFGKGNNPNKCGPKNMNHQCVEFYKKIISDISEGYKVRDIPGFSSLLEFSTSREIKNILYSKVISYSHKFSAGYGYVSEKAGSDDKSTFQELFKRASNNQKPYVGLKRVFGGDHSIIVTGAKYKNGIQVLCASDPNERDYNSYKNEDCSEYIELKGGSAVYRTKTDSSRLAKFNIYTDEDDRTVKYVKAWKDWCMQEKEEQGLCRKEHSITKPE